MGYTNGIANCIHDDTVHAIAQAYCVFDETITGMTPPAAGRKDAMGADWADFAARIHNEGECLSYGGDWNGTNCT